MLQMIQSWIIRHEGGHSPAACLFCAMNSTGSRDNDRLMAAAAADSNALTGSGAAVRWVPARSASRATATSDGLASRLFCLMAVSLARLSGVRSSPLVIWKKNHQESSLLPPIDGTNFESRPHSTRDDYR